MGSSSTKNDNEKNIEKKEEEKIEEIEQLEEIQIIVDKSQNLVEEQQKKEEERKIEEENRKKEEQRKKEGQRKKEEEQRKKEEEQRKKEEEQRKKEEFKQSVLKKINDEEIIIKKKFTDEDFTNYIINFYEEFIQIYNSLQKKNSFIPLIFEFNKKYIYTFNNKDYPDIPLKASFFEILKYSTIIIVCLVFMSKDLDLHKKYCEKIKEPIEKFIYSIINIVGRDSLKTKIINNFVKNFKKLKRGPIFCINDVIDLLFSNAKNENTYKNLKNALNQIIEKLDTEPLEDIIIKINECILFFYNAGSYIITENNNNILLPKIQEKVIKSNANTIKNNKKRSKTLNKSLNKNKKIKEEEKKIEEKKEPPIIVNEPFVTEPMTKEFCLILDIDETISHTMRLSFGNYFLLRPGVLHLIKKLYHFFEIDIFTAALKRYADNIVNKLDPNDIYINYRFYREHCIYEGTKSVKKLIRIGRELEKIIFVDNIKYNAKYNMENLYHVSSWKDNVYDDEIAKLQNLLIDIIINGTFKDDIRKGIAGKDDQVSP